MKLKELVDTHGVPAVAKACGVSEGYIKRCLSANSSNSVSIVKLVNAAKKLNS